jgi:NAD(P)H dehydrogenase (quinone)
MAIVSVIHHSLRDHTARQAEAVARGVSGVPGVEARVIRLSHEQIGADGRWHDADVLRMLNESHGILFGSVTLFGTVSAVFKAFLESTFGLWYEQAWKDKFAGGFTNSAALNGDKQVTLMMLLTYAAQMGMLWVPMGDHPGANWSGADRDGVNRLGSFLGPMAQSDSDGTSPTPGDLRTAERYGERFALIVRHWLREGDYATPRMRDAAATAAFRKARIEVSGSHAAPHGAE